MRPQRCLTTVGLALLLAVSSGCQTAGLRFLSLVGLKKEPLAMALVVDQPTEAVGLLNPFTPYQPLQKAMGESLRRPIAVDLCMAFQVETGLKSGWHDLAVVSPAQYARLTQPEVFRTIVCSVDGRHRMSRPALLVVPADSDVRSAADLRGKVVAFGPAEDSRTHYAALKLLHEAGLRKQDLALDVLPIPGSLKHFPHMRAVALAVINGSATAGFIDEAAWEEFPEEDAAENTPARSKLRVIDRTKAVPDRIILASPTLDEATIGAIRTFLLQVGEKQPEVLSNLTAKAYAVPGEHTLAACRELTQTDAMKPAEPPQPAAP